MTKALQHRDLAESAHREVCSPQALSQGIFCSVSFSSSLDLQAAEFPSYQELSSTCNLTAITQQNKGHSKKCLSPGIRLWFVVFFLKAMQDAGKPQLSLISQGAISTKADFGVAQHPGRRDELLRKASS